MNPVLQDALERFINFVADSVNFGIGLTGAMLLTALSLSGEVIDEWYTYSEATAHNGFPWPHVAKVMVPPMALAIVGYVKHRQDVAAALNAAPREKKATVMVQ
jgi:hypothetical protein